MVAVPPSIVASPAAPVPGEVVHLHIQPAPKGPVDYRWDLAGAGTWPLDTGNRAETATSFSLPGEHRVSVQITAAGTTEVERLVVRVARAPVAPTPVAATPVAPTPVGSGATAPGRSRLESKRTLRPVHRPRPRAAAIRRRAHVALDQGLTITDFRFAPGTITVHAGDTLTWRNDGPSPHTATARDGSFDTGLLRTGQSAGHTFTRPGTFTYICAVHPFMRGTVVVLARAASAAPVASPAPAGSPPASRGVAGSVATPPGRSAATPAGGPASTASAAGGSGQPILPLTGADLRLLSVLGLVLGGIGVTMRRWAR